MNNINFRGNGDIREKDYFEELVERFRIIRTSEMRTYEKVRSIFKECSEDYDLSSWETSFFYAKVQNKILYAHTGKTALELKYDRVNSSHPNMGLNSWKNSPEGNITKADIGIAKNYLNENEIDQIRTFVEALLTTAETISQNNNSRAMLMEDWIIFIDDFIKLTNMEVLVEYNPSVTSEMVKEKLSREYIEYKSTEQNS